MNNIIPIKSYIDVINNKKIILEENKNKSGIYRWINLVSNKSYIGSAVMLNKRLSSYLSEDYLIKVLNRNKSKISSSLLKNNYDNFRLDILEYCDISLLIEREQYYIDSLLPEYNILKVAGSRLGNKHTPETLIKLKNRKHSSETILKIKKAMSGKVPSSSLRKTNHLLATGHTTTVLNTVNNTVKIYSSIRTAADEMGTSHTMLLYYMNKNKLFKDIYLITRKEKK